MNKKNYLFAFISLLLIFHSSKAQTTISSIISADQTWTAAGNPYLLTSSCVIEQGVKVTIKPGVIVKSKGSKFYIDGELQASGKVDSVIVFDSTLFDFTAKATGYNFSTGAGSFFNYCYFNGTGTGGSITINLSPINMLIKNSKFYNCYYCIYGMNANMDTAELKIQKTVFQGGYYPGYAVYTMGRYAFLYMDECLVKDMYGLYLANYSTITRSTFYNWLSYSGIRINAYNPSYFGKVTLACNTFRKFKNSIIELYGIPTASQLVINNNTFDSVDYLMDISLNTGNNKTGALYIHQNNFLNFNKNSILLKGGNTPGKADTIDFRDNYWGTTNTSQIEAGIRDFKDDIAVAGIADFTNYLSNPVTDCVMQNPDFNPLSAEKFSRAKFSLAPNPAESFFTVNMPENSEYRTIISAISGATVYETTFTGNSSTISTAELPAGMYFVNIIGGTYSYSSAKLIISK